MKRLKGNEFSKAAFEQNRDATVQVLLPDGDYLISFNDIFNFITKAGKWDDYVKAIGMVPNEDEPDPKLHAEYIEELERKIDDTEKLPTKWREIKHLSITLEDYWMAKGSKSATDICADELEAIYHPQTSPKGR